MIEISPIITSHPVQKIKKVARDNERQSDNKPTQDNNKNENNEESNDQPELHIDEIV